MIDKFIDIALEEAKKAYDENEVPVGAVIVKNNVVIARTHNVKLKTNNVLNHAEILAILKASSVIGDWRLNDCVMYITLEPCPMCAGAIAQSRIKKIFIGAESNIKSNKKIINDILQNNDYYHNVEVVYLNNGDCSKILSDFFSNKR